MLEPFVLRALAAAIGLAIIAAPLGSLVVWNRMAYFGEAVAQASLIGIALSLALDVDLTASVMLVTLAFASLLIVVTRQKIVPVDSILGLMHHTALATGIIATSMLAGQQIDLMSYLFGDVFAVSYGDLLWIYIGGAIGLAGLWWLWDALLRLAVHEELAAAEGVNRTLNKACFIILLALTIAIAIKIVGALLIIAFLIVPAVAARPLAHTPEMMAIIAAIVSVSGVILGITASLNIDAPGGPSIVLATATLAGLSLIIANLRPKR